MFDWDMETPILCGFATGLPVGIWEVWQGQSQMAAFHIAVSIVMVEAFVWTRRVMTKR